MGKRKAAKKPQAKKKAEPLGTVFKCLFCNHEKAVSVKLDKATMFGSLTCKVCGQRYSTPINNLSVAVDVYCDWVDACEEVRVKQPPKQRAPRGPSPLSHGQAGGASFDPDGPPHPEQEDDAEGEADYDDDDVPPRQSKSHSHRATRDPDDEDDVDEDDDDDRGAKRRRVRNDYDDDDDDDDE
ncbi:hypothetical protein CI109_100503 [Kwoniella shandongensis]|uniref:Transcription elongation factor 1 homolog n=1 Tax=Kwoniella shandongensis TaxID=1734106 RepID=A0A5M6C8F4_9TREE|nr:uncharacterized protein CI109_001654 [Kwoniella shandongensis]KAA5529715.1 hypothetical protein CI109_001654 [Kwoniella shandongensis]